MNHLSLLIGLKLRMVKNAFRKLRTRSRLEFITLFLFMMGTGLGLFLFFHTSFRFFNSQEPFGPILIDETFYLFTFTLFLMLLISTGVSSYASLYRSPEIAFLATRPIAWSEIYFLKLAESLWYSSWSFLFIITPFMTAYGIHKNVALAYFPLLCFGFFLPFVLLAGILGSLGATLTVWLLPSRKRRRMALIFTILAALGFFLKEEPEMIKEQGSIAGILSGYLPNVAFAKFPLLPSYWATIGIQSFVNQKITLYESWQGGGFYFLVLSANALFFCIPCFAAARGLYPHTYLRAQDYSEYDIARRMKARTFFESFLDSLPWPSKAGLAFLEKDLKTFLRDPSAWSQLIIFFGLLLFYFLNLKNFQFHMFKDFWKNIIFILNTVGTFIILSSFNMRFVFPMLSLEGSKFWIIRQAPIRYSSMLLVKFLIGTMISALFSIPLVTLSGWMLEIPLQRVIFTVLIGFFVCVGLTGLSVGFGAKFPNFKSNNPAEIISGFGGSALLICHLLYLTFIGAFLAVSKIPLWLTLLATGAGSLLVGFIPLKAGVAALKKME